MSSQESSPRVQHQNLIISAQDLAVSLWVVRGVIICYIQMDKISKILNHINVGLDLKCQEEPYPCYSALAQVDRVVNEEPNQPIQQTYVNNSDFIK